MPYCSRCGVEVNKEAQKCPLCSSPIQKFADDIAPGRTFPTDELPPRRPPQLTLKEKLRLAAVITTFAMLIPMLITLAVDLTLNARISWSWYPLISLTTCLFIVLTALYAYKHPRQLIWGDVLICSAGLLLMYSLGLIPGTAVRVGIPISAFAGASSHMAVSFSGRTARKGSNIGAFVLMAIGLFCLLAELWIDLILYGGLQPGWSLIVLGATQPVTLILLYLHYRKKKDGPLKKYFHI
jgi:hypothetical protein